MSESEERGAAIKARRLALGINHHRELARAAGKDRQTVKRAEEGTASEATYDSLESWLDRQEQELGLTAAASPIKISFHDVTTSSIGEIVVEGAAGQSEEMVTAISRLLEEMRKGMSE